MNRRDFLRVVAATAATPVGPASAREESWQAAVASVDITPERSLWMAGFARRTRPSEGVALPLHAKALALQAGTDPPAILVTVDLLGLTAGVTDRVAKEVERRHHVGRASLLFNASHTQGGREIVGDRQLFMHHGPAVQAIYSKGPWTPGASGTAVRRTSGCAPRPCGWAKPCCSGRGGTWRTSPKRCGRCSRTAPSSHESPAPD